MSDVTYRKLLILFAQLHGEGKTFPSYSQMAATVGSTVDMVKSLCDRMHEDKVVLGSPGKKPMGVTELGKTKAKEYADALGEEPQLPAVSSAPVAKRKSLAATVAEKFNIDESKMFDLVSKTMISKDESRDGPVTREEVAVVMHVMNKYDLDPLAKQLHAFYSKGKIQLVVGYDGWVALATRRPDFGGVEYAYSEDTVGVPAGKGVITVPLWIDATCHSTDKRPTTIRANFWEWFIPNHNVWGKYPFRRLQQKAYCMAVREHFGVGLADTSDREQMEYSDNAPAQIETKTNDTKQDLRAKLRETAEAIKSEQQIEDAEVEEIKFVPQPGPQADFMASEVFPHERCELDPRPGVKTDPLIVMPTNEPDDWELISGDELSLSVGRLADSSADKAEWMGLSKAHDDVALRVLGRRLADERQGKLL